MFQAKLRVGAVDDPLEREADRVAEAVVSGSAPAVVQRKCAVCEEEETLQRTPVARSYFEPRFGHERARAASAAGTDSDANPVRRQPAAQPPPERADPLLQATVEASVSTPGETLPAGVRAGFAPTLGAEASVARIHRGSLAESAARLAGAKAFTYGSHIVLGREARDFDAPAGRRTLAHELVHVGQQAAFGGGAATPSVQFDLATYRAAMGRQPEPDWATAATHLNGESSEIIDGILEKLSPQERFNLHAAARTFPGLCSAIGRKTEGDYLSVHPETTARVANTCEPEKTGSPAAAPPKGADPKAPAKAPAGGKAGQRAGVAASAQERTEQAASNSLNYFFNENILIDLWADDCRDNDKNGRFDRDDSKEWNAGNGNHLNQTFEGFRTYAGTCVGAEGGSVQTKDFDTTTTVRYRVCADVVSRAYREAGIPVPRTRSVFDLVHWFKTNRQCRFWLASSFVTPYLPGDFICSFSPEEGQGHAGMVIGRGSEPHVVHLPGASQHIARNVYDPARISDLTLEVWPRNRTIYGVGRFVG